ncbi:beta-lactamase family protein [Candidatus Poribacteria bacterium]|nr:beta-lactamase family protein [Candidatus Poribacteria bacterium]MYH82829.1 beta-lactamase family protein [Candidatus Poribacteria bacterium]MYK96599.1 beta-lactamase family protein [Candidatus Poribacteria bacterium]
MATHETLEVKVDQLFAEWNKPDSPGAAVAVTRDGEVIYKQGYGTANLEYDIPITPTTVFDIASVSKQFAAFAITTLAHEGKLSLDDDIRLHLPDVPDFGNTITIRHLLHHTSGLRDWVQSLVIAGVAMEDVISFKHILKMARHQKALNFEPGEAYLYSNTGYNLLAEIVERVTGDSFRQWTNANIFKPLGMTNSRFHDDHQMILKNRAYSYQSVENGAFKHAVNNTTALGSSSLYSTVEDLAKWILNFDSTQIGEQTVIEQMHQQGVLNNGEQISYALGLNIGEYRGLKTVGHSGSWRGFRSHLIRFPDQKFGVVILCNLDTFNPLRLAEQVTNIYLADVLAPIEASEPKKAAPAEDIKPETLTPEQLTEFEGDYYTEELDTTYSIRVHGNQLIAQHIRHDDILLTYTDGHFLGNTWFFPEIRFTRDDTEQVTGFGLTGGRVRNLHFEKKTR